jgi:hypothetical protein
MPDRTLMYGTKVQSQSSGSEPRFSLFRAAQVDLQLVRSGGMDVIGTAATLYQKRG